MVCNLKKQKEDEITRLIDRQVELQSKIEDRKRNLNLAMSDEKVTAKQCLRYCLATFITFKDEAEPLANRYEYKVILCIWRLTIHPLWKALFLSLVLTDVIILGLTKHEEVTQETLDRLNRDSLILLFSNAAFLVELIFKLMAYEFKVFFGNRLNVVDLLLCILFTTLFLIDQSETGHFTL